jgi:hypothetical protein
MAALGTDVIPLASAIATRRRRLLLRSATAMAGDTLVAATASPRASPEKNLPGRLEEDVLGYDWPANGSP